MPPNWDCRREGTEWLCVSQYSQKAKEAIIILTAKEAGPSDTLAQYEARLKEPRMLPKSNGGPAATSKILHVQQRIINNQPWVDSLHMGSEVSSYYTRYLGTVKERIALLVTFSAHKSQYTLYSNDFIKAIESLRVTASKDLTNGSRPLTGYHPGSEPLGQPIPMGDSPSDPFPMEDQNPNGSGIKKLLGLALILIALGIFIFLRTQKKSTKSTKSTKTKK
ncbi:MAG: hypothetical protein K1X29_02095 [Bdellovibrionales bacterium]|nr:hypothetical protein [Bdellovibrionales bacterium]